MTDLEMTRLCAEAMGLLEEINEYGNYYDTEGSARTYWPLHDDAQLMALVKKFEINICWFEVNIASKFDPTIYVRHQDELNRAIVECVAKMQLAKPHG